MDEQDDGGVVEFLHEIGKRIAHQDNRATANPIFIVQQQRREHGYDSDYCDTYQWIETECGDYQVADDEEAKSLDAKDFDGIETKPWEKVYYKDRWEFVTSCFTEQGCKDYLAINGHNLSHPRIYVESGFRNDEWKLLREYLRSHR